MRKYLAIPVVASIIATLISWGSIGHKTVALIAEQHLTPQAKAAVKQLLGNESLADVANWADEVRSQPEYRFTAPMHYVNAPSGLSFQQFRSLENGNHGPDVVTAITANAIELSSQGTTLEQKAIALKFLVHFVGDIHQPMHVSHAEDKGGNAIQVQYNNRGTNLHSVWDSKLIDQQGLTPEQFVKQYGSPSPKETIAWNNTTILQWAYESYAISEMLYKEVANNNKLDDAYYNAHIRSVDLRLQQAGIRLADMLNSTFKNGLKSSKPPAAQIVNTPPLVVSEGQHIELSELSKHIGEFISVRGKVFGFKELGSMTLVNVGGEYPNQLLTIVLRGDTKSMGATIDQKFIEVTGKLIDYKGKPEIEIKDQKSLLIIPMVGASSHRGGE